MQSSPSSGISAIASRLAKLIPRLASNHDGEVLATVQALRRTLESASLDLHSLARELSNRETRSLDCPPTSAPTPADWRAVARWCADQDDGRLSRKERDFLATLRRWRGRPTSKQLIWLTDIHDRLQAEVGA